MISYNEIRLITGPRINVGIQFSPECLGGHRQHRWTSVSICPLLKISAAKLIAVQHDWYLNQKSL